jgi:uncharacterized protein (DUF362 family)
MHVVETSSIGSYADTEAISRLARAAIALDPRTAELLGRSGRDRLVVVKPNWVQQAHQLRPDVWEPVITHPAVVSSVVAVLADAMKGRGTIAICDAPQTDADFAAIVARGDLEERLSPVRSKWPSLRLEILDLRREVWRVENGVVVERRANPPDPRGYVAIDLGRDSLLHGFRGEGRYYGADYDVGAVNEHHHGCVQEYLIAGTPMACDLFVNLPKLKTHKKTGITCSLKNLVGINGDKNWLPHHTEGVPASGGDEFPEASLARRVESAVKRVARHAALRVPGVGPWAFGRVRGAGIRVLGDSQTTIRNGNWHGNDTCWRMALDLNRAFLYGNPDGTLRDERPRAYLTIVDGIVGGQGDGPLCPDPIESGVMIAGTDPAIVDAAACRLMGFEPEDVPLVEQALEPRRWPLGKDDPAGTVVVRDSRGGEVLLGDLGPAPAGGFRPHFGWPRLGGSTGKRATAEGTAP